MKTDWTKNLKDEEKKKFENTLLGSRIVIDRLQEILEEYEKSLNRSEVDIVTYEKPGWDYRQAHKNGYRSCLYKIMDLINLDQRIINER